MAHKTLIGGTAYEISGGKTLVNGTAYSIDKGKTLVGGTAYEVGFAPAVATVVFTLAGSAPNMITGGAFKMTINGIDHTTQLQSQPTYSLNIGDSIVFTGIKLASIMVSLNGANGFVAGNPYTYSVKSNVTIQVAGSGTALLLSIIEQ